MNVSNYTNQFKFITKQVFSGILFILVICAFISPVFAEEVIELEIGYDALEEYMTYQLDSGFKYKSNDLNVCTVDENGLVEAKKFGETLISIMDNDNNIVKEIEVIVYLVGDEPVPWGSYSVKMSYINGYPDGTFRPKDNITRAEIATIFSKILNLEDLDESNYLDVQKDFWGFEYINKISNANLMNLRKENMFYPNSYLTKEEFAIILSNYSKRIGLELNSEVKYDVLDVNFKYEGFKAIHEMLNVKILDLDNDMFYPENFIQRDEAVRIINKIIDRKAYDFKIQTFNDVSPTDEYFIDIEAAVNGM